MLIPAVNAVESDDHLFLARRASPDAQKQALQVYAGTTIPGKKPDDHREPCRDYIFAGRTKVANRLRRGADTACRKDQSDPSMALNDRPVVAGTISMAQSRKDQINTSCTTGKTIAAVIASTAHADA